MMTTGVDVLWFKKDLRLPDHRALTEAVEAAYDGGRGLVLLYLYEPSIINGEDTSRRHLLFLNQCLEELSRDVAALGGRLWLLRGEAVDVLTKLHEQLGVHALFSHEETGNDLTYARDRAVAQWCAANHITWHEFQQHGVIRRLTNRDGWARRWAQTMNNERLPAPRSLPPSPPLEIADQGIQSPESFAKFSDGETSLQIGGRKTALHLLDSFLLNRGRDYTKAMSSPVTAFDACSRLSPYLAFGCLSVREAYQIGRQRQIALKATPSRSRQEKSELRQWGAALNSFLGRLRWHCHFMQKLEDEPELEFRNLSRACDGLRENDWNREYFEAWKTGRTGYPMVDACMRALTATGWINFRMRAMLMSFASYHLWLHWRATGLHLARLFTDYEPGIHWSQVQMQSGTTGINSIRVYSPTKQALDHDPSGVFIRQWVPELHCVPANYLAEPWTMPDMEQAMCGVVIGRDYPAPIVDHATAYREAQAKIRSVRRTTTARAEQQQIYKKHGSRRKRAPAGSHR